jgi:peptidoglycan/LPS O-acetylase OafA/YrhL
MYAHGSWAEVLMLAGGAELGLVHGRLRSRWWRLTWPLAFVVTGVAFIVHEQNPWFFARSAFLHHLLGWTFLLGALIPLALAFRPRSAVFQASFALVIVVVSVMLFSDRDVAPVFGHLSPLAGPQHR